MLLEVATSYYLERIAKRGPHFMCEVATQELYLRLLEKGIQAQKVVFDIDASYFDGKLDCDILEHHCLKIGKKILDVTAAQFKNMPLIYFGPTPLFYATASN